jgi:hypothetical protein
MADNRLRSKTPRRPDEGRRGAPFSLNPLEWWRNRPRATVTLNRGEVARRINAEEADERPTPVSVFVRLLPVWALIIMILLIEPTLPIRAVDSLLDVILSREDVETGNLPSQVFIVEPVTGGAVINELPPPNWSLEVAAIYTAEVRYWSARIADWSVAYRIKPNMIATIMQIESCGNPDAVSPVGAYGLMQVMPLHFQDDEDPFEPDVNAGRSLIYLGELLASVNGDTSRAFAAYNGGPGVLDLAPEDWPEETRNYQFWASGIYEEAELGFASSPTLENWLDAGGASLCAEASAALGLTEP